MSDDLDDSLLDIAFRGFTGKRRTDLSKWIKARRKYPKGRQIGTKLADIRIDHRNRYSFALNFIKENGLTEKVLDAGCGIGYGSYMMAPYINHIDCIDFSPSALEIYEQNYKMDNINFICDSVLTAKIDSSYDAVVCFEFIEHIEEAVEAIKRFSEVSEYLIASVPNQTVHPFDPAQHLSHVRHYTLDEFTNLLSEGNYQILEIHTQINETTHQEIIKGSNGRHLIIVARKSK